MKMIRRHRTGREPHTQKLCEAFGIQRWVQASRVSFRYLHGFLESVLWSRFMVGICNSFLKDTQIAVFV
jgi:hypothetical protein